MTPLISMRAALNDPNLFGSILPGPSWAPWRILLIAAMGEALNADERAVFTQLTGRDHEPGERVEEFWAIIGRRGGKTRAIAVLAAYIATCCDFSGMLAPGEIASLPILSATVDQAQKALQYLDGIFHDVAALKKLVTNQTADSLTLSTRVCISVTPANWRSIRGGTAIAIIADEVAAWRSDSTANPDAEILAAARPCLATTNGMLACITSPYARKGVVWETAKRDYGSDGEPSILVAKAPSRTMNPTLKESWIKRQYERDPFRASAEYGAEFRSDIESYVSQEAVEACVSVSCFERPYIPDARYVAFVDPAGGSGQDSMTLAIGHMEKDVAILDLVREVCPPFSPQANPDTQWCVLRALRIVPLPSTVDTLCKLVEQRKYDGTTYDAIVALGRLPSSSPHVTHAAQALSAAIEDMRQWPWVDGVRTAAIAALGNLQVESSASLLLQELTDDNPAIIRQASRSTQRILGLGTTVSRVVEAALRSGTPTTTDAFGQALRWMDRDAVAEELERLMGSGSDAQQEMARTLLRELGGAVAYEKLRARTASMKQYIDVLERAEDRVRKLFEQTVHEAQKGFDLATWMDVTVFGIGILLILASAANALLQTGDLETWAGVGGVGVLGVVYGLLIANPRKRVREAIDHLMKIKIIFLAYLRQLHQTDQAYTRLLLDSDNITAEQLNTYSELVGSIMDSATKQLPTSASGARAR